MLFLASLIPGIGFSQSKADATPDYTFDWGLSWLVGEDGVSEYVGSSEENHYVMVHSRYLGYSSDYTGSNETSTQPITVDLKIPVPIFDIVELNVEQKSNGHLIQIHCTKHLPDFESWLKPIGDNTWLYITLADAKADVSVLRNFKPTAFIKRILIFQSATCVQLTFMLKGQVNSAELIPAEESQDILVAVFTPMEGEPVRVIVN